MTMYEKIKEYDFENMCLFITNIVSSVIESLGGELTDEEYDALCEKVVDFLNDDFVPPKEYMS